MLLFNGSPANTGRIERRKSTRGPAPSAEACPTHKSARNQKHTDIAGAGRTRVIWRERHANLNDRESCRDSERSPDYSSNHATQKRLQGPFHILNGSRPYSILVEDFYQS